MTSYSCPTLLHLAARYGLQELTARLVDLPDARLACGVKDRHGARPQDVALQHQHHQLAGFLHNFREMVSSSDEPLLSPSWAWTHCGVPMSNLTFPNVEPFPLQTKRHCTQLLRNSKSSLASMQAPI